MDEARKKLRVCLIFVVAAAIIIGLIYYFNDVRNSKDVSEGTLVRAECSLTAPETKAVGGNHGIGK